MTTVSDLKTQLASGKLSRRRFMEGAAALGVSLAAAKAMMGEALAAAPEGRHLPPGPDGRRHRRFAGSGPDPGFLHDQRQLGPAAQ